MYLIKQNRLETKPKVDENSVSEKRDSACDSKTNTHTQKGRELK